MGGSKAPKKEIPPVFSRGSFDAAHRMLRILAVISTVVNGSFRVSVGAGGFELSGHPAPLVIRRFRRVCLTSVDSGFGYTVSNSSESTEIALGFLNRF